MFYFIFETIYTGFRTLLAVVMVVAVAALCRVSVLAVCYHISLSLHAWTDSDRLYLQSLYQNCNLSQKWKSICQLGINKI